MNGSLEMQTAFSDEIKSNAQKKLNLRGFIMIFMWCARKFFLLLKGNHCKLLGLDINGLENRKTV